MYPKGCKSCEELALEENKKREEAEKIHIDRVNAENKTELVTEMWKYGQVLNLTNIMIKPDMEVRRFLLGSASQLSPLMGKAYRETMERVPYENSWAICAPEQATALRTLTSMVQPRECLDIGSFTGLSSAAVLEALPSDARITSLEINLNYSQLLKETLAGRNVDVISGNASDSLQTLEEQGRQFDLVVLDSDYPFHEDYFNASIRLLRPGGVIVLFGMLYAQGVEGLHEMLPTDTRIKTAMLPLGCGLQVSVKTEGVADDRPFSETQKLERKRWQLESEVAAIDRALAEIDNPDTLKVEMLEGPLADPSPVNLIAFGKQHREQFEATGQLGPQKVDADAP